MKSLDATFSKKENGWVATMVATGNTQFLICLEKAGRVVVRRSINGRAPTVLCTPHGGPDFSITFTGDTKGRQLTIITSEQPKKILYANI